jgi:uncharacterized Zn finger protein (UPF0148 family)
MKKCPSCGHKLYGEDKGERHCKFCGYSNQTSEKLGIPKVMPSTTPAEKKTAMQKIIDIAQKTIDDYENLYFEKKGDFTNIPALEKQEKELRAMLKKITTRTHKILAIAREEENDKA